MHLTTLLEMAAEGFGPRVAFGSRADGVTFAELHARARAVGHWLRERGVDHVALVDVNSVAVPTLLYGSAYAGIPFAPLNYRLDGDRLRRVVERTAPSVVVADPDLVRGIGPGPGVTFVSREELARVAPPAAGSAPPAGDPDGVAVLLFTSGTTGEPKAALLRHRHLAAYVLDTVEFMGAGEEEAALVGVPPYHVAGISAVLSSTFSGRRVVYLASFSPEAWIATVRRERITHAMVVPTMLARILDRLDGDGGGLPTLRHLSCGGGRMPTPVIERALDRLPGVGFVNAYGLTETSSTIALLGPEDHRRAHASSDPALRRRLASVGRPLPSVQVRIVDADGAPVDRGRSGEVWVRGPQVAGEYRGGAAPDGGWFCTRDRGWFDDDGFLFLEGRTDDVIVRGGENLSPGEIEEVLLAHPGVRDVAVVGRPDGEWGEVAVAVVVPAEGGAVTEGELQDWVRTHLRSSKVSEAVVWRDELPYSEMGKLLRAELRRDLSAPGSGSRPGDDRP